MATSARRATATTWSSTTCPKAGSRATRFRREALRFTFPRQREGRGLCISDFLLSKSSGKMDVLAMSCVTIGDKASHETQKLFEGGEYTKYFYLHGLSVETAEALAELSHKEFARNWESPAKTRRTSATCSIRSIAARAIRSAIPPVRISRTRPSCSRCCIPTRTIGVHLTTGFLLDPEQSTSAIIVHHPAAKYFVV